MLKKTKRQVLMMGLAGLVTAGSLFGGVSVSSVYAQEEAAQEEAVANEETSVNEEATEASAAESTDSAAEAQPDTFTEEKTTEEAKESETESTPEKQAEDNSLEGKEETTDEATDSESAGTEETTEAETKKEEKDNVKANVPIRTISNNTTVPGLEVNLYKMSYDSYTKMYERFGNNYGITWAGGNAAVDEMRNEIKNTGELVEKWISGEQVHFSSLSEGVYAVVDESVAGNGGQTFFQVNENGQWRKAAEYIYDENGRNWKWTEAGEYGTSEEIILETYIGAAYAYSFIVIKSQSGTELVRQSQIELYRKTDSGLEKVDLDIVSKGEGLYMGDRYDTAFKLSVLYPGEYVIKCVSVPSGYEKFADITFEISRKGKDDVSWGYPIFNITDSSDNLVKIIGLSEYDSEYGYGVQDENPAVIEITLKDESTGGTSASGDTSQGVAAPSSTGGTSSNVSSNTAANTSGQATAAKTASNAADQVTAANTGDRNFTYLYFTAAGAVIAAGVSAMVIRRKKEEK